MRSGCSSASTGSSSRVDYNGWACSYCIHIMGLSPLRHRLVVSCDRNHAWRQWRANDVYPAGAYHVDTAHRAHGYSEGRSLNSWATDTDLCTALLSSSPSKLCSRLDLFFALMFCFLSNATYTGRHSATWAAFGSHRAVAALSLFWAELVRTSCGAKNKAREEILL
jgi:hypothetical protein